MSDAISADRIEELLEKLSKEAGEGGYHLNPDLDFTRELVRGLLVNTDRYGYPSCPCRAAEGTKAADLDIICPCDYRDPDLAEFGACYCALYVSADIAGGEGAAEPIPERRPPEEERKRDEETGGRAREGLSHPVWRCRVCGYLCARDEPPETCPVCKARRDRFERFM